MAKLVLHKRICVIRIALMVFCFPLITRAQNTMGSILRIPITVGIVQSISIEENNTRQIIFKGPNDYKTGITQNKKYRIQVFSNVPWQLQAHKIDYANINPDNFKYYLRESRQARFIPIVRENSVIFQSTTDVLLTEIEIDLKVEATFGQPSTTTFVPIQFNLIVK